MWQREQFRRRWAKGPHPGLPLLCYNLAQLGLTPPAYCPVPVRQTGHGHCYQRGGQPSDALPGGYVMYWHFPDNLCNTCSRPVTTYLVGSVWTTERQAPCPGGYVLSLTGTIEPPPGRVLGREGGRALPRLPYPFSMTPGQLAVGGRCHMRLTAHWPGYGAEEPAVPVHWLHSTPTHCGGEPARHHLATHAEIIRWLGPDPAPPTPTTHSTSLRPRQGGAPSLGGRAWPTQLH